jgi:hypothetical protein
MTASGELIPIWKIRSPSSRAAMPEWMSFHFLLEAEKCPRACALKNAWYLQLWDRAGFPSRPVASAFAGLIVHSAAELIIKRFMQDGVKSAMEAKAMETLRSLGGYTMILSSILDDAFQREADNPRFQQFKAPFLKLMLARIPRMRESLQELLRGQAWISRTSEKTHEATTHAVDRRHLRLGPGTYFEVELRDKQIMWKGRADIITLSEAGCSISDLKTGSLSDHHQEQMIVYSVLWDGDQELNANQVPISDLHLCYSSGSISVSVPAKADMNKIRANLHERTARIKEEIESDIVPARPSIDNCQHCQVKLLCDDYWTSSARDELEQFRDVELVLHSVRGDSIWAAKLISVSGRPSEEVISTRSQSDLLFWSDLREQMRIRLTDVCVTSRGATELPLVSLTVFSEALILQMQS